MTDQVEPVKSIYDVPEEHKTYKVITFSGEEIKITSSQKNGILATRDTFIVFPKGDILNKSAIERIVLDKEATKKAYEKVFPQLAAPDPETMLPTDAEVTKLNLSEVREKLIKNKSF